MAGKHIPTLYERETYCTGAAHKACPVLRLRIRSGHSLSEDEYIEGWTSRIDDASRS